MKPKKTEITGEVQIQQYRAVACALLIACFQEMWSIRLELIQFLKHEVTLEGVFLPPPPPLNVVNRRFTPSVTFAGTHLYTWVERGTVRVKCVAQEHNTMSSARAYTVHQGRFPLSQKFRKFRFGAKWKMFFRFAWLENSQKKWNCLEGSPGSSTFSRNFPVRRTEKTFSI